MKRRNFALGLAAATLAARSARAAVEPVEGKHYQSLSQAQPVAVPGKVEVIEFFGYWCPHCRAFEPTLEAWVRKLPADVSFRRVPVAWQARQEPFQRLYYALEALGVGGGGNIHQKVFDALQVQGLRLEQPAGLAAFAAANGIDQARLADAMGGFSVSSKARVATQTASAYRIDGVPTLAIQGRYITSPSMVNSEEMTLQVAEALIRKARAGR